MRFATSLKATTMALRFVVIRFVAILKATMRFGRSLKIISLVVVATI
jgi:hypothetical protein